MINNPKVSIALCTYNGGRFLNQQLQTLVKQSYGNLEIVIVDDCSTDDTYEILSNFSREYPIIKLFKNEQNLGFIKNFEKAIKNCFGDYICLCDQDDSWDLLKVEQLVANIGENILIYHDSNFIDQHGELINEETMSSRYNMYEGSSPLPFLLSNCISGHAAMFSKKLIDSLLPFDKNFYHDWWIAYVAFNTNKPVKYLDKILVSYRQHLNSITDNFEIKSTLPKNRILVNLAWLKKCSEYDQNKEPKLINRAYTLFRDIQQGENRFKLFLFLIKHFDLIFYISRPKKNWISKVNFVRKICFTKNKPFYTG